MTQGARLPQDILDDIKSLSEEQLSFQRSSHALIVDLSNRVKQIVDEGSSRERRAILLELVLLYDSFEQVLRWVSDSSELQPKEAIVDRLETLRVELLEILMRREVRPYDGTNGVLDRRLHRTIKTVPTSDPSLNDRVEAVVRTGFFWREQVLRPEEVIIFKHKPELREES
jgi:molecular chaperone GrpE (heat shock protein)